jgi:glutathione S-transferase
MKLFYSPTSPYARKCRAAAIEKGLEARIEVVAVSPMANPPELLAANPLAKVPALVLADGRCIVDSRVICQFIDSLSAAAILVPRTTDERHETLTREALADGISDAAFNRTMERLRPEAQRSPDWIARWTNAIRRTVGHFNANLPDRQQPDLGDIALACALGYLDLRHGDLDWRKEAPALAQWFAGISARPSIASTAPPSA